MNPERLRAAIAARHEKFPFRALATGSEKYLRAYHNQLNWNVRLNGEAFALRRITSAIAGDVLDIGANEGQWAMMALGIIGSKPLHCFELVPAVFRRLKDRLQGRGNVLLNDFGLASEERSVDIYFPPASSDRSSAYSMPDGYQKEIVRAFVMRGDDYLSTRAIHQVAFAKIDVEGMEMDVLRGLEGSMRGGILRAVQFEHGPAHVLTRHFLKDFVDLFEAAGWVLFRIFPNALRPLCYNILRDETFIGQNFLAAPPDVQAACRF